MYVFKTLNDIVFAPCLCKYAWYGNKHDVNRLFKICEAIVTENIHTHAFILLMHAPLLLFNLRRIKLHILSTHSSSI